jgi:hypothetical protein
VTPEVLEGQETLFPPDPQPVARPVGLIRSEAYIQRTTMQAVQSPGLMPVSNAAQLEAMQQQARQSQSAESAESALRAAQAASEEAKQAARAAERSTVR